MPELMNITFLARPTSPLTQGSPGHAFFVIALGVGAGIREECFGFYPQNHLKIFWGPGTIKNDFKTSAIPNVSITLKHAITEDTYRAAYDTIKKWAGSNYGLLVSNCGDFMFDVANSTGLKIPNRLEVMLPTEFVEQLTKLYWSTSWQSSDAQSRFSLIVDGSNVDWIERSSTGAKLTKKVKIVLKADEARIERDNTDEVLNFLGFQPTLISQIIAAGPKPSYMVLKRVGSKIEADWYGLLAVKDNNANLQELKQPGSMPPKKFDLDRIT